ncbi:MAG: dipicolinate synthase subunit DpsA [Clostridiaceae bacterium]|nr:dipicolinate synthase subunit DpsA [Clostridiaceae bacterium]
MKIRNFAIIGGDLRNLKLAGLMMEDGNNASAFGFDNVKTESPLAINKGLHKIIEENDVIVAPLPCSNDDETIYAPFSTAKIYINDVFKMMNKRQLFIAGRISEKIIHLAEVYKVYYIDMLKREEMAVLNAIPTAEGAIQIAMEELPITLHGSNALILGFGRIGKILAKMLYGIGANVHVEARKYSDIAWIKCYGYKPVFINELENHVSSMDIIFNTVPALILDDRLLKKINNECLIIDLASSPGGIDHEKARHMGLNVIWALSLPGKVAPVTAAKYIRDTIYNVLDELGV